MNIKRDINTASTISPDLGISVDDKVPSSLEKLNPTWYASGHTVLLIVVFVVVVIFGFRTIVKKCRETNYQRQVNKQ